MSSTNFMVMFALFEPCCILAKPRKSRTGEITVKRGVLEDATMTGDDPDKELPFEEEVRYEAVVLHL